MSLINNKIMPFFMIPTSEKYDYDACINALNQTVTALGGSINNINDLKIDLDKIEDGDLTDVEISLPTFRNKPINLYLEVIHDDNASAVADMVLDPCLFFHVDESLTSEIDTELLASQLKKHLDKHGDDELYISTIEI